MRYITASTVRIYVHLRNFHLLAGTNESDCEWVGAWQWVRANCLQTRAVLMASHYEFISLNLFALLAQRTRRGGTSWKTSRSKDNSFSFCCNIKQLKDLGWKLIATVCGSHCKARPVRVQSWSRSLSLLLTLSLSRSPAPLLFRIWLPVSVLSGSARSRRHLERWLRRLLLGGISGGGVVLDTGQIVGPTQSLFNFCTMPRYVPLSDFVD